MTWHTNYTNIMQDTLTARRLLLHRGGIIEQSDFKRRVDIDTNYLFHNWIKKIDNCSLPSYSKIGQFFQNINLNIIYESSRSTNKILHYLEQLSMCIDTNITNKWYAYYLGLEYYFCIIEKSKIEKSKDINHKLAALYKEWVLFIYSKASKRGNETSSISNLSSISISSNNLKYFLDKNEYLSAISKIIKSEKNEKLGKDIKLALFSKIVHFFILEKEEPGKTFDARSRNQLIEDLNNFLQIPKRYKLPNHLVNIHKELIETLDDFDDFASVANSDTLGVDPRGSRENTNRHLYMWGARVANPLEMKLKSTSLSLSDIDVSNAMHLILQPLPSITSRKPGKRKTGFSRIEFPPLLTGLIPNSPTVQSLWELVEQCEIAKSIATASAITTTPVSMTNQQRQP